MTDLAIRNMGNQMGNRQCGRQTRGGTNFSIKLVPPLVDRNDGEQTLTSERVFVRLRSAGLLFLSDEGGKIRSQG